MKCEKFFTVKTCLISPDGSYVPESCCASTVNIDECTGRVNATEGSPPLKKPPFTGDPSTWGYTLYTKVSDNN